MIPFAVPDEAVPRVSSRHRAVPEGDDTLVVDGDGRVAIRLNASGALLWELFDGSLTFGEVAVLLGRRYRAEETVRRDILDLLRHLYPRGLVTFGVAAGDFEPRTWHVNRSRILIDVLREAGWRPAPPERSAELSMWWPHLAGPRIGYRQLFEPWQTRELDSKRGLFRLLRRHHLTSLAPDTWDDLETFLNHAPAHASDVFYVKKSISGRQQGIHRCHGAREVVSAVSGLRLHPYVIQREVPEPMLLEERKYNVRCFLLVTGIGQGFLYRRASIDLMPSAYDTASEDPCSHFNLRGSTWRRWNRYPIHTELFDAIHRSLSLCAPLFASLATGDETRYVLFGVDYLFDRAGQPYLLELNHTPHLGYGDFREESMWTKGRLMADLVTTLLQGPESTEFVPIA